MTDAGKELRRLARNAEADRADSDRAMASADYAPKAHAATLRWEIDQTAWAQSAAARHEHDAWLAHDLEWKR